MLYLPMHIHIHTHIYAQTCTQGCKVGIFTSPHLHTARERIKINRKLITHKDFITLSLYTQALMGEHK
ncbi:hypothetical protein EON63_11430 [archaeon]|nr:MAG: hypothetical protein EON63_11430 [archaeon]